MNYFKTSMLLAAMTALFCAVGFMMGGQQGMMTAFIVAIGMNFFSWWFSGSMVLRMYGAKQVESGDAYDITAELVQNAGIPMPKVYVINSPQPNAFATGSNPANGAVAVTSGIMEILSRRELRGVIAHELAHIKNRDTLTMTITATIAGALGMLTNFFMFFGNRDRDRPGHPLLGLVVMILAPLAASLVQFAISRTREYAADHGGAEISNDPEALASALEKIQYAAQRVDNHVAEQNPATAHMFIINPLHMRAMDNLFSTHPSTQNRVTRLRQMGGGMSSDPTPKGPWQPKGPWERVA